ncbi:MAG: BTAD domain-containing putative transcriptional regulator, partial [Deinococcota bacterium]
MLSLFGASRYNGEHLALNKPVMLLVYLAHQGDWVSRDELAFLLKPDADDKTAKNYVRVLLHRTKQIPLASELVLEHDKLKLPIPTDTQQFNEAVNQADDSTALQLYTGEFLAGFDALAASEFVDWLYATREQYAQQFLTVLGRALNGYPHVSDTFASDAFALDTCASYLKMAMDLEPYEESWQLSYYQYLASQGQQRQISSALDTFKAHLADDMDIAPSPTFEDAVQRLLTPLDSAALTLTEASTNISTDVSDGQMRQGVCLPKVSSTFIGRQQELDKLVPLFESQHVNLISLVGLGGSGKTRLALELARRVQHRFHQIYFNDLRDAHNNDDVQHSLISTANPNLLTHADSWQAFKDMLTTPSLLVLDNCEHLTEVGLLVTDLMQHCPTVTLLATSRQALHLAAEHLVDVTGLTCPPHTDLEDVHQATYEDVCSYDAAALFCARVEQVQHGYTWTKEDITAVIQICQLTAGLPLALELAASWARLLSVPEIASELRQDLALLTAQHADDSR